MKKVGKTGKMHPIQSFYNFRAIITHVLIDARINKTEAG